MTTTPQETPIERVLWIGYNTHAEAVAKGIYVPDQPWTYDLHINFGRPFSRVTYAVAFGKADVDLQLTPQIRYRERAPSFPRLPKLLRLVLELPAAIRFLQRAARETDPQVVQVCGPNLCAMLVWLVPRLWRVPKMCFIEAFWETLLSHQTWAPRLARGLLPIWYRCVYRMFDGYCGAPSLDRAYYVRRGMDATRIHPWVLAIDLPALARLDARDAPSAVLAAPRPRVVSVGRLHPEKFSLDALEIFLALCRDGFPGSLVLVGDGPLRAELERRAEQAGLRDRLVITGLIPLPDGYRAVKACDLYLATMQGLALIEAMAAGMPIVAYDHETHRAMLSHGATAILVPNRDIHAAAAALLELARDDASAARLGAAAAAEVGRRYGPAEVEAILAEPLRRVARRQPAAAASDVRANVPQARA